MNPTPDQSEEQGTAPTPPVFVSPRTARNSNPSNLQLPSLSGSAQLSPSEQNVNSARRTDVEVQTGITASSLSSINAPELAPISPQDNLRISSEPMNILAAQAQARLADEPDIRPAQSSASLIHPIPNAVSPAATPSATPQQANASLRRRLPQPHPLRRTQHRPQASAPYSMTPRAALPNSNAPPASTPPNSTPHSDHGPYNIAQTTPSAQDAASGAYSAPQSPAQQPAPSAAAPTASCQTTVPVCPPAKPAPSHRAQSNTSARANPLLHPLPNLRSPRKLSATLPSALRPKRHHPPPPPNPKRNPAPTPTPAPPTKISSSKISRHSAVPGFAFSARPLRPARAILPSSNSRPSRADTAAGSAALRCSTTAAALPATRNSL